nr:hypothetical protein [Streptomyces sp. V4I2]
MAGSGVLSSTQASVATRVAVPTRPVVSAVRSLRRPAASRAAASRVSLVVVRAASSPAAPSDAISAHASTAPTSSVRSALRVDCSASRAVPAVRWEITAVITTPAASTAAGRADVASATAMTAPAVVAAVTATGAVDSISAIPALSASAMLRSSRSPDHRRSGWAGSVAAARSKRSERAAATRRRAAACSTRRLLWLPATRARAKARTPPLGAT